MRRSTSREFVNCNPFAVYFFFFPTPRTKCTYHFSPRLFIASTSNRFSVFAIVRSSTFAIPRTRLIVSTQIRIITGSVFSALFIKLLFVMLCFKYNTNKYKTQQLFFVVCIFYKNSNFAAVCFSKFTVVSFSEPRGGF